MKGLLVEGVSEAVPQVPRGSEQFVSSETNYSAPAGWGEVEGLGLGENVEREKKSRHVGMQVVSWELFISTLVERSMC